MMDKPMLEDFADGWDDYDEFDYCPDCGTDFCVCDYDEDDEDDDWDDAFWYSDEEGWPDGEPVGNQYHPQRTFSEWLYYTYRRLYFRVVEHLPRWLYNRLFPQDEVPF